MERQDLASHLMAETLKKAEPGPVILLVEDNEDNRIIYSTYLRYRGYRVLEAADGEAGVAIARAELPDLILMDVSLPKMDGLEATRILKSGPTTARIPIVALTAHALLEDRQKSAAAGCDGYISKPVEPAEVVAEIERLLAPS
jgi:two-component system cell cycle response regulator DivK